MGNKKPGPFTAALETRLVLSSYYTDFIDQIQ
jgi:hypothetical protein